MRFGQISPPGVGRSYNSKELARTPWILEGSSVLARGMNNRLIADGRYTGRKILSDAQRRLNSMISASENSAYRLVFGSNPVGICGRGDQDEDLLFA